MSTPFNSNTIISAADFMTNLVTLYNDYWSDPAGSFQFDAQHTVDQDRRKGWGQSQVKVKGTTEIDVSIGTLIESEHLNSVIAQVNAGLQHIDNNLTLLNSVSQNVLITAAEVEVVRQKVLATIDPRKFQCEDDINIDNLYALETSNGGTVWTEDLYIEHTYTFIDYDHARHFFNGSGELTIALDMDTTGTTTGVQVWDQLFDSFGEIRIGAINSEATQEVGNLYQAPNIIPNRGFYSIPDTGEYTTLFETAGAFADSGNASAYFVYIQSAYNSRRLRVEAKAVDNGVAGFDITIRVALIEDEDDTFDITGNITVSHGFKTTATSPDTSTVDMNPYTGVPGATQYRFQPVADPVLALTTTWTADNLTGADQVSWDENEPGNNFTGSGNYYTKS